MAKNKTYRKVSSSTQAMAGRVFHAVDLQYGHHRKVDRPIWERHLQEAVDTYGGVDRVERGINLWLGTEPKANNIWPLLWNAVDEGAMFSMVEEDEADMEIREKWDYVDSLYAFAHRAFFDGRGQRFQLVPAFLLMFVEQGFDEEDVLGMAVACVKAHPKIRMDRFFEVFPKGFADLEPLDMERLDGSRHVGGYLAIERAYIGESYANYKGWDI